MSIFYLYQINELAAEYYNLGTVYLYSIDSLSLRAMRHSDFVWEEYGPTISLIKNRKGYAHTVEFEKDLKNYVWCKLKSSKCPWP